MPTNFPEPIFGNTLNIGSNKLSHVSCHHLRKKNEPPAVNKYFFFVSDYWKSEQNEVSLCLNLSFHPPRTLARLLLLCDFAKCRRPVPQRLSSVGRRGGLGVFFPATSNQKSITQNKRRDESVSLSKGRGLDRIQ